MGLKVRVVRKNVGFWDEYRVAGWSVRSTRWFQKFMGMETFTTNAMVLMLNEEDPRPRKYSWPQFFAIMFRHHYRAGISDGIFYMTVWQWTPFFGFGVFVNSPVVDCLKLQTGIMLLAPAPWSRVESKTGRALRYRFWGWRQHGSAEEFEKFKRSFC